MTRIKAMVNNKCPYEYMRGQICYIIDFDRGNPVCTFAYYKYENDGTYKLCAYIRNVYLDYITIIDPYYIADESLKEWNDNDIQHR